MSRSGKKANRLLQIEALLLAHPEGLTQADIARKLQVHRATIGRYIPDLDKVLPNVYIDDTDGNKWKIDRERYLVRVQFNLYEALAVHLSARLLATRMDKQNPHAAAALRKLGISLEELAPQISNHVKQAADIADDASRTQDPRFIQVLEKLALAWAERRKVHVWHRHEKTNTVHQYLFAPYFIEPYAVGQTIHVIGKRDNLDAFRTFKIERIERIEDVKPAVYYDIPETFNPRQLLSEAWGIWYTDEPPQKVVLRFSESVVHRVEETKWHGSQKTERLADGRLLWKADIAEPQEMLPWIRGWGSDAEVLEPNWLRRRLKRTAEDLGELYQIRPPLERRPYQWLYAKTDRKNPQNIHLLLYHLIDVGQAALAMWKDVFPASFRNQIAQQLDITLEAAGRFVAFIASLHDLGKASPAYQKKYSPDWLKKKLADVGFVLDDPIGYSPETNDKKTSHAYITTWTLPLLLVEYCGLDEQFSRKIGQALGGHHGAWPINSVNFNFDDSTCLEWDIARRELVWELRSVFQPPAVPHPPADAALNIFLTLLSGLVSVADWLGSRDDDYSFPLIKEVITTREYAERSQAQAKRVLHDLGWTGWQANHKLLDFSTMFQYLDEEKKVEPRPIQQEIMDITAELAAPSLIIIEAPTGIGKTEIALYLADTLLQKHRGRGLYIAMPTQATSNQMFDRAAEFLRQRYPENMVNLHLAHGQAAFDERIQTITLRTVGDNKKDDPIVAMSWFNQYSKRTLLAPFGVGTVDQTLMSVLQTKHFFVRLLGLSHKVVVFDEVHAYDAYMGTLFQQLLQWLRAIGTSVIMLSATLPAETRRKFVDAYTGQRPQLDSHYPVITIASAEKPAEIQKLPSPNNITLEIEWKAVEEQIDHILSLAQKGGCIAVICNTVGRAQVTFRQLLEAWETGQLDIERDNLILFHARFPPIWRKAIEEKTKKLFGKPQKDSDGKEVDYRPQTGPVIIVATQVIEQSLDLDFDAMITDLAPIDLLIQRAGRLHRHEIRDSQRHGHARQLTIIKPKLDDQEIPHFGSDEYIYERYVLLRTYRALEHQANKNRLTLPGQTIDLIEAVYDASDPFLDDETNWQVALKKAHQKMRRDRHESQQKAKTQLAGTPDDEMLLYETNLGLEEDNPAVHHTMRTQTRDIGPTLSLICLHATEQEDRVTLDPEDATATIDLKSPPDSALVRELLQRRINVQHWALLNHFLSENPPPKSAPSAWRENSTLRYMRAVIFQDGEYRFADEKNEYVLSLNRDYGLELKYQVKEV